MSKEVKWPPGEEFNTRLKFGGKWYQVHGQIGYSVSDFSDPRSVCGFCSQALENPHTQVHLKLAISKAGKPASPEQQQKITASLTRIFNLVVGKCCYNEDCVHRSAKAQENLPLIIQKMVSIKRLEYLLTHNLTVLRNIRLGKIVRLDQG